MKEIKASKKAPKKVKRIASVKDAIGEDFVALFHDDVAVDADNLYFLFALKEDSKSLVLDLHTGCLYLNDADTCTPVSYDEFPQYLKKGGKGSGKYKHLSEKNWRDLTDKARAQALETYHHPAPVVRQYPTNVTPPDFEAYYIKVSDGTGEQSVYLRNVGAERWRVFFAKSFGTRLGFDAYACSEYTFKDLLAGKDRRAKSGKLDFADRLLGIDEVQYLSAFMPNVHEKKRKNALALTGDDSGASEVTAYYWKEGKSIPCADEDYVLGLFTALKEIACCSVELEFADEDEDETTLSPDPAGEDMTVETEAEEATSTLTPESAEDLAAVQAPKTEENGVLRQPSQTDEAEAEPTEAETPVSENTETTEPAPAVITAEETAELLAGARREEFEEPAPVEESAAPATDETDADESAAQEDTADEDTADKTAAQTQQAASPAPVPAEDKTHSKKEKKGLFSRLKNHRPKAVAEISEPETPLQLETDKAFEPPVKEDMNEPLLQAAAEVSETPDSMAQEAVMPPTEAETQVTEPAPEPAVVTVSAIGEETAEVLEQQPVTESLTEDDENTSAEEAAERDTAKTEAEPPLAETANEEAISVLESEQQPLPSQSVEAAVHEPERTQESAEPEAPAKEPAAEAEQVSATSEAAPEAPAPVRVKKHRLGAKEKKQSEKTAVRFDLPQLISAYVASGKRKAHKKEIVGALSAAPLIVPIHASNIDDADLVYISKQAYEMCKTKIIPFVMMEDKQALLPGNENAALRAGVMVKTVLNKGKTYIPVFADFKSAKQVFGQNETFGIFTFKNISNHIAHNDSVEGITVHPGTLNIKIDKEELNR